MKLVSAGELSKLSGKSRAAVYKAIGSRRLTKDNNGKIDLDNEDTKAFMGSMYVSDVQKKQTYSNYDQGGGAAERDRLTRASLENERIKQQIIQYRLKNAIQIGDLVSREMVKQRFISPLDELFIRIISDLPKTIVHTVKTSIKSNDTDGESELKVKRLLERTIRLTKEKMKKGFE